MAYYKDINNGLYSLESSSFEHFLPENCVQITDVEYATLLAPPPLTPQQIADQADKQAQRDLKAASKLDAIFTDIATDTLAQLVHKIEVQFPNPTFTNQQQKLLKVCLIAAAITLIGG